MSNRLPIFLLFGLMFSSLTLATPGIHQGSSKLWPGGIIPYEIDFSLQKTKDLEEAIDEWNDRTHIKLVPKQTYHRDYVAFEQVSGRTSISYGVGRQGGRQRVALSESYDKAAALHEIGHVVGFHHTHQRSDRDRYVAIGASAKNVRNFSMDYDKLSSSQYRDYGAYDFDSVMHYNSRELESGVWNVERRKEWGLTFIFSLRDQLTDQDIKNAAQMYTPPIIPKTYAKPPARTFAARPPAPIKPSGSAYGKRMNDLHRKIERSNVDERKTIDDLKRKLGL